MLFFIFIFCKYYKRNVGVLQGTIFFIYIFVCMSSNIVRNVFFFVFKASRPYWWLNFPSYGNKYIKIPYFKTNIIKRPIKC